MYISCETLPPAYVSSDHLDQKSDRNGETDTLDEDWQEDEKVKDKVDDISDTDSEHYFYSNDSPSPNYMAQHLFPNGDIPKLSNGRLRNGKVPGNANHLSPDTSVSSSEGTNHKPETERLIKNGSAVVT